LDRAAACYREAALLGYAWAQFNLANLLLYGLGVAQDRRQALDWYVKAAAQGHAKSMNMIGRFYDEGWSGPPDPDTACDWYRRSAEAGDFRGQFNHATVLLARGQNHTAYHWLKEAVCNGSPDFLATVGMALTAQPDPQLRRIGTAALSRAR